MINKRKMTALLLSMGLIGAVLLTACAKEQSGSVTTPDNSDGHKVMFTMVKPVFGKATYTKGGPFEQEMFKRANAEIDVQIVPSQQYSEKVNVMLAAGEIPDVVWLESPWTPLPQSYIKQGAFVPINKYLDKYPALKEAAPPGVWDAIKDNKGDIYYLPLTFNPVNPATVFYRKDWFDKLNIPEPKTVDDLISALEKIKNADPDGNGQNDTIPLTAINMGIFRDLATSFGASITQDQNLWVPSPSDANKLIPWFMDDKAIDFYVWMQQNLHKKGLIDPDFLINKNQNQIRDKFKAGKSAVVIDNFGQYPSMISKLQKIDPNAKVGVVHPLQGPFGKMGLQEDFPVNRGLFVSSRAKDPEGIFRFLNWTMTEGYDYIQWGTEGKSYKVLPNGDRVRITDKDPEYDAQYDKAQREPLEFVKKWGEISNWAENNKSNYGSAGVPELLQPAGQLIAEYAKTVFPDYRHPDVVSPTEQQIGNKIYEDYLRNMVDSFVLSDKLTKQDWLDAVKKWENAGGDKIIGEVNSLQKDKKQPKYSD